MRFEAHERMRWGLLLVFVNALPAFGHEGHQPLPTKGVQVDLKSGHITLSDAARDVPDIEAVEVQSGQAAAVVRAYASVVPPWTGRTFVTTRLSGRITKLWPRPGDVVEAGQELAVLDSVDLHALRLDYQQAHNELELSARILESVLPAAQAGSIPGQRLVEAENTHRQNQNTLNVLRAKAIGLQVSEKKLIATPEGGTSTSHLSIFSPIRGVVVHADVAVGQYVEPTEHLFEIVDTSRVWVKIGVLERDLYRVQEGQAVQLTFNGFPGKRFGARIDKLGMLLDPVTHQGTAWGDIVNSETGPRMLPGMNGQAEVKSSNGRETLLVPTAAVFSDGAERYVFVEVTSTKASSEYRKTAVVIGRQTRDFAEILTGDLYPGDRVVTRGGHELSSLFFLGVLRLSPTTAKSIGVTIEPVSQRSVERTIAFDGAIDVPPQLRTSVASQLPGTIRAINVDRGQAVKAGDILAEVASLELQDLQLELLKAQLDGALWRDTHTRLARLGDVVPRRSVAEMDSRARVSETRFANLSQKLTTLGMSASQIDKVVETRRVVDALPVRAPMDGTVVHFDGVLGQVVRADTPLFTIHNLSQPWVQAFIGERESAQIEVGQTARIRLTAKPELEVQGTVARIAPVVGAASRTQAAWIEFRQPSSLRLQHNMFARVIVTTDRPSPSLAVPASAIVRDGLRSFVFVQKADGTLDRRRVEVGRADDRFLEITGGLKAGELIATGGVPQLQTAFSALR